MYSQFHRVYQLSVYKGSKVRGFVVSSAAFTNQSQTATAVPSMVLVSAPVYISKDNITADSAQQHTNTFIPCLIGFFGLYCIQQTALPLYLIILSSIVIRLPAIHAFCIRFIILSINPDTLYTGLYATIPLLGRCTVLSQK